MRAYYFLKKSQYYIDFATITWNQNRRFNYCWIKKPL